MSKIVFLLLQSPRIFFDGEAVALPFKKAEGLLYYLAVKKSTTREEAAALLWADSDEQTAKKNLRHTLYTIKKTFGQEIIVSPQKQLLSLNPELTFSVDYHRLLSQNDLDAYQGEFLQGFYVKNAPEFETWVEEERIYLKDIYLRSLYAHMLQLMEGEIPPMETAFSQYTREDPLDERVYLLMMKAYQRHHLYHKGIKIYQSLSKLLDTELRISPSREIAELHRELLNAWTESAADEGEKRPRFISGRTKEFQYLRRVFNEFLTGKRPPSPILTGEMGVGKTYLMNAFLDDVEGDSCLVLRSVCFQAEQGLLLQPWNAIMMQLDRYIEKHSLPIPKQCLINIAGLFPGLGGQPAYGRLPEDVTASYNYRVTRNSILKLLFLVGEETPLLLAFDNIQYMDPLSLELLSLVLRERNPNVLVTGTCPDVLPAELQKHMSALGRERLTIQVPVHCFSPEDVSELAKKRLGADALTPGLVDALYRETEGNAFFLEVLLSNFSEQNFQDILSVKAKDILLSRLSDLSVEVRQVLDVISIFHDHAFLDTLEFILNQDTLKLLELLEELKNHSLIQETVEDQRIRFRFRHSKMREFVHSQLSPSKQRLLHSRAAACLEQQKAPRTPDWYQNLIYHYQLCGNEPKALQYRIAALEAFSSLNFDLYPIMPPQLPSPMGPTQEISDLFQSLFDELYRLYHLHPEAIDYSQAEARLLLMSSKYYISQGYYQKGIPAIRKAVTTNEYVLEHPEFHLQCLRQLTFYSIQIWDTDLMAENIAEAMSLAKESSPKLQADVEYAIEYRLYGLLLTLKGLYQDAAQHLFRAIELFQRIPLKSQSLALNVAACYNYLGEIQRKEKRFLESLAFYDEAIQTCSTWDYLVNPTFYTNKARALWALGREDEAEAPLALACRIYDDTSTLMGRAIAKCYYSRRLAAKGEFAAAADLLEDAAKSALQLSSPLEMGLLALTKAALKETYPEAFETSISDSLEHLKEQAGSYLADLPGVYELEEAFPPSGPR